MVRKKRGYKKRQNLFVRRSCESLAMLDASNKISFVLAKKYILFYDGEDIVKPCHHRITKWVGDKSIARKVNKIALSKQTITRHTDKLSYDVSEQQKDRVHTC